jgi:hypothetical protein
VSQHIHFQVALHSVHAGITSAAYVEIYTSDTEVGINF